MFALNHCQMKMEISKLIDLLGHEQSHVSLKFSVMPQSHESLIKAKRVANHEATKSMEISDDEDHLSIARI